MTKSSVQVRAQTVSYWCAGSGPPLLLVHGLGGSAAWWQRNIAALSTRHRVYALDLPGFGHLRHLSREFSVAVAADWLDEFAQAAGLAQIDLVGHSMGGLISALYAARHPAAVRKLVLAAPALAMPRTSVRANLVPLVRGNWQTGPRFLPRLTFDAARAGVPLLLRAANDVLRMHRCPELTGCAAITLLLYGERDRLVPPTSSAVVQNLLAGTEVQILPGAGHVLMWDRPELFNEAVLEFLSRP